MDWQENGQIQTAEVAPYLELNRVLRILPLGFDATAAKMYDFRVVIWGMHGVYGAGKTMDETFGLIETVEKAAQIYMLTAHLPRVNTIRDEEMVELAEYFGVKYRKDFLTL